MLSIETENQLAEIFFSISNSERQVEENRYYLSKNSDFDPYNVFKELDRLNIGLLSTTDFQYILDKNHFFCSNDEAYLLIKQYDSNLDGKLSIEDFISLVLPSTNSELKSLATTRRGFYTTEIEYLLVKLLSSEILYHRNLESAKINIMMRKDFSITEAFRTIDIRNTSCVDRFGLINFLRRHHYLNDDDIDAIFRRVDNDADELINYQEFVDIIVPFQTFSARNHRTYSPSETLSLTQRSSYESKGSQRSGFRNSSPLRLKSTSRNNNANTSLLKASKTNDLDKLSLKNIPSLRDSTLNNPTYSSSMRSVRENGQKRSSPLRTSPTRNKASLKKTSSLRNQASTSRNLPLKHSMKKNSSSQRNAEKASKSFSKNLSSSNLQSKSSAKINPQESFRKSSPLRRSSPEKSNLYESRAGGLNSSRSGDFNSSRSQLLSNSLSRSIEEKELVLWFQEEIIIAREIENKKNELALKPDFNLNDAFRLFDKHDLGVISISNLEETLNLFSFYASSEEIYLLMNHFSHFQNQKLYFSDFSDIFSPKQEDYSRILRNRPSIYAKGTERLRVFTRETQNLFFDTLRLILNSESLAERVRQRLNRMPQFNLHSAFQAVDKDRNGFITIDEFQSILTEYGIFVTSKDLQNLMVSYSEFIDEATPKSSRRY